MTIDQSLDWQKKLHFDGKITAVFEGIEEKPSFEAVRVGKISDEKTRSDKVSLPNSDTVHRILFKAKKLQTTKEYRKVYISPDRSLKERDIHRTGCKNEKASKGGPGQLLISVCSGVMGCRDKD